MFSLVTHLQAGDESVDAVLTGLRREGKKGGFNREEPCCDTKALLHTGKHIFFEKKGVLTRLDQSFTLAGVLLWCASLSHHQKCIAKTSSPVLVHFLVPLTEMVVLMVGTKL